jgi:hypothetical protein
MQHLKTYFLGLALLFFLSCAKDNYISVASDVPVFYSKFTFGGLSNVLTAGVESYLFTDYRHTDDSVTVYSGIFADPVCYIADTMQCRRQLSFFLRGFEKNSETLPAKFTVSEYNFGNVYDSLDTTSGVPIANIDDPRLGTASIQWIDNDGVLWRSDLLPQSFYKFYIRSTDTYIANERSQNTIKMSVTFSCTLYNPSFEAKKIEGEAVIAIGTP